MKHLVLLGDSIFDNGAYTSGGPDVISQVRQSLPEDWKASLLAVDGAVAGDVLLQIPKVPAEASHLVLSAGGNNALMNADVLRRPTITSADAMMILADVAEEFEKSYLRTVKACLRLRLPLAICTIYNGCFPDAVFQRQVSVALTVFNDVILRVAIEFGLTVIDLRSICNTTADYANPIEPSSAGGEKIARSIAGFALGRSAEKAARVLAS